MKAAAASDAVRSLLGVHVGEEVRWSRIDRAVKEPSEEAMRSIYGIDRSGRNYAQQMQIARQSFNPVLELLLSTYGQSLKVANYFLADEGAGEGRRQSEAWEWWQRNRMDGRQTGLHHSACKYGLAYTSVLPADMYPAPTLGSEPVKGALIGTHNPRKMTAVFSESWDMSEYPILALQHVDNGFRLYDEEYVYFFGVERKPETAKQWSERYYTAPDNLKLIERRKHGVGVTPVVRYRDKMMTDGEESFGMIEPMIGVADRINQTNFQEGVARMFSAFKQRYIIGWQPKSEAEAFRQKASDTWWFRDEKNKVGVGQFDETDLGQYVGSRQAMEQAFAALGQMPATVMGASAISNVSAEGLAALERSKDAQVSELQTALGEAHEQTFRLAAFVAGDMDAAYDFGSEVVWEDTSAKSLAQVIDALGKMAVMLGVPVEELWPEIPGWTSQKVARVRAARDAQFDFDPLGKFGLGESEEDLLTPPGNPSGKKPATPAEFGTGSPGGGKARTKGGFSQMRDGDGDGVYGE